MAIFDLSAFFAMGLGLGMVHAFDPDHLAAVGGISSCHLNSDRSTTKPWHFALHWSFGHGGALSIIAIAVFFLGSVVPARLSGIAEQSVALVLIAIGIFGLVRIVSGNAQTSTRPSRSAPLVGLLHGTAGSAPLLALIPLSQIDHPVAGMAYVLFFSAGVALAMVFIGGLMTLTFRQLAKFNALWLTYMQMLLALFSLLLGIYLVIPT